MTPFTDSICTIVEVDTPTRNTDQAEPTEPSNTPGRPNTPKENAETPGNEGVDSAIVPTTMISHMPNLGEENQEMEVNSLPTHPPHSVEEL